MKLIPDNLQCDLCDAPATVKLRDSLADTVHLYCSNHAPDRYPGKNQHLKILRWRSEPGDYISRLMTADVNSPEHQSFREEMCDLKLLGNFGACQYYLSRITYSNQFALWNDEFLDNAREFVLEKTDGAATLFPFDIGTVEFMVSFFKHAFAASLLCDNPKLTKQERAIVMLVHHPTWTDERIAKEVPTTTKQLQRNTDYAALRRAVAHQTE